VSQLVLGLVCLLLLTSRFNTGYRLGRAELARESAERLAEAALDETALWRDKFDAAQTKLAETEEVLKTCQRSSVALTSTRNQLRDSLTRCQEGKGETSRSETSRSARREDARSRDGGRGDTRESFRDSRTRFERGLNPAEQRALERGGSNAALLRAPEVQLDSGVRRRGGGALIVAERSRLHAPRGSSDYEDPGSGPGGGARGGRLAARGRERGFRDGDFELENAGERGERAREARPRDRRVERESDTGLARGARLEGRSKMGVRRPERGEEEAWESAPPPKGLEEAGFERKEERAEEREEAVLAQPKEESVGVIAAAREEGEERKEAAAPEKAKARALAVEGGLAAPV
jgi:hypothetical protein